MIKDVFSLLVKYLEHSGHILDSLPATITGCGK